MPQSRRPVRRATDQDGPGVSLHQQRGVEVRQLMHPDLPAHRTFTELAPGAALPTGTAPYGRLRALVVGGPALLVVHFVADGKYR